MSFCHVYVCPAPIGAKYEQQHFQVTKNSDQCIIDFFFTCQIINIRLYREHQLMVTASEPLMHFVESCTFFPIRIITTAQSVTIAGDKDNIFVEEDRVHTLSDAQSVNVSQCVCPVAN